MITIAMLTLILPIIAAGCAAAAYYSIDHQARKETRQAEFAAIDTWLTQIRQTR